MAKIRMNTPLVEIDGDEMTRVIWKMIKDHLLTPYIDLKTEYYDLGLPVRDQTDDKITVEAAEACKKYGVGVKCATITPNQQRVDEYKLKKMYKSPNGTIRAILDGTVFRAPITLDCLKPSVRSWKKPITIARHAFGDVYKATEYRVPGPGKALLSFYDEKGGKVFEETVNDFKCPGVLMATFNKDDSIESFARACCKYAVATKQDLWFSAKDTIAKKYDGEFRDIFQRIVDTEFKEEFKKAGITYFYTLIDDAVARVIRSEGGFIWACKNYDGDVMSDMVATAFGSLAMMTSVLVSPDGKFEYEAAHGTVTKHYYKYRDGETTSTNCMATLFAWTGALNKRGELDGIPELQDFSAKLEKASLDCISDGFMTKDLASLAEMEKVTVLDTEGFILKIKEYLDKAL
ncbi:MAG: Isocitrate dehydrogenase (NADP) [Firmicutes bacterium ADurb.Bin248]|nr:MAG: Isocitrate dehydrogenase (NADP) [Firmicutes bacterium ADurb.Bin248]HOF99465.1 NADP-dependent isocitrate dehydrogenase [Clostridia bacterium]